MTPLGRASAEAQLNFGSGLLIVLAHLSAGFL
jgi:hypothetical protein